MSVTEGEWSSSATVQQGCQTQLHWGPHQHQHQRCRCSEKQSCKRRHSSEDWVQRLSERTHRDEHGGLSPCSMLGDVWGLHSTTADGTPGSEGLWCGGPRMGSVRWPGLVDLIVAWPLQMEWELNLWGHRSLCRSSRRRSWPPSGGVQPVLGSWFTSEGGGASRLLD